VRIALFTETFLPKWDGIANTLCHLLDHLAARGHESLLFAPRGAPERYAATEVVGLPSIDVPLYPGLRLAAPAVAVGRRLREFQPDLVHLVGPFLLGTAGLWQARLRGIPVAASYHTDLPGYAAKYGVSLLREPAWLILRTLHNQADLNLCPSRWTRDELAEQGFRRLAIWGRGVDSRQFRPGLRSESWRWRLSDGHPDAPLLLYAGRLAPEKRVEWLRDVADALPGARLAIVGDGPSRPELERRFAGAPTVFTGTLRGRDLARAYAAADVFVFPSANETLGNVVLEAMASGLPVAAPASGGLLDHVRDGENGFLVEPEDRDGFVAIVKKLAEDEVGRRRMGRAARAYAENQSWERVLDDLLARYEALVEGTGARRALRAS